MTLFYVWNEQTPVKHSMIRSYLCGTPARYKTIIRRCIATDAKDRPLIPEILLLMDRSDGCRLTGFFC
jgi:hypothetical protein